MNETIRLKGQLKPEGLLPKRALGFFPWSRWKIKSKEMVFLPFYVFPGEGGAENKLAWAVDGIKGSFRVFSLDALKNRIDREGYYQKDFQFRISLPEAKDIAEREAPIHKRFLEKRGIRVSKPGGNHIRILYPFWVFYLEKKGKIKVVLVDAINGTPGGPKLNKAFYEALDKPSS